MNHPVFNPDLIKKYIIYEDNTIIAVNKPEGLLTIPDGYQRTLPNLYDLLKTYQNPLWVVHRLDKLTSGVILFAKNAEVHKELNLQFQNRLVRKEYAGFIHGFPFWEEKLINRFIRVNGDRRHRTVIDLRSGKPAITKIKVIQKKDTYSIINIFPRTGYSHQIRCHLASIGHPILGDELYCFYKKIDQSIPNKYPRLFLHAKSITFRLTGQINRTIQADLPNNFSLFSKENS